MTGQSIEDQLFEAMDRQALRFIEMLDNDAKDKDGVPEVSIDLKLKLFEKGEQWLMKRKKLRPESDATEGDGITDMRNWISNPDTRQEMRALLHAAGVVLEPEKKPGRPTRAEAAARKRYKEHTDPKGPEDAGWRELLDGEEE